MSYLEDSNIFFRQTIDATIHLYSFISKYKEFPSEYNYSIFTSIFKFAISKIESLWKHERAKYIFSLLYNCLSSIL